MTKARARERAKARAAAKAAGKPQMHDAKEGAKNKAGQATGASGGKVSPASKFDASANIRSAAGTKPNPAMKRGSARSR